MRICPNVINKFIPSFPYKYYSRCNQKKSVIYKCSHLQITISQCYRYVLQTNYVRKNMRKVIPEFLIDGKIVLASKSLLKKDPQNFINTVFR